VDAGAAPVGQLLTAMARHSGGTSTHGSGQLSTYG
jgi:hypothetical protein